MDQLCERMMSLHHYLAIAMPKSSRFHRPKVLVPQCDSRNLVPPFLQNVCELLSEVGPSPSQAADEFFPSRSKLYLVNVVSSKQVKQAGKDGYK